MDEKPKINPQPGDIATGPVVKSRKRTTPRGNIEIKVPKGELPEGYDISNIVPILVDRAIEEAEVIEEETVIEEPVIEQTHTQQPKAKEDDDKKPVIVGCLPIALITLALATSIGSCDFKGINIPNIGNPFEYTRVVEREEIHPFEEEYIEVNGPQNDATGLTGLKGQEGLTNNAIEGEENPIEGDYYSGEEHFQDERLSATGLDEFKESQEQVRKDIEDIAEGDLTQDEIEDRLESIEAEIQEMEQQYADREELMEEGVQEFKEATMVNQDEISEDEIAVAEEMKEIFDEEHETVNENLEGVQEIIDRAEEGQEIQIDSVKQDESARRYTITGKSIEKVVEQQKYSGIRAVWEWLKDWFRGDQQKNIDDNQR